MWTLWVQRPLLETAAGASCAAPAATKPPSQPLRPRSACFMV